jgi:hypothetical protein
VANKEHLERLQQGTIEWNTWRFWNKIESADLSTAQLSGLDLRDIDLSETNLSVADLSRANLSNANLSNANLSFADLSSADLSNANISFANLNNAILDGAKLTGAYLYATVFSNVDLTAVVGLETCQHLGPSGIDLSTLKNSKTLPSGFLRGVGLLDSVISHLASLVGQPGTYSSCFISYSHRDEDFAKRIRSDLMSNGVHCWFAPHDLPIGSKILDEIDAAIRQREKVVLILSEHSIKSGWVKTEVTTAFEEERSRGQPMLFPIRLDDAVMQTNEAWAAQLRADRHMGDFCRWKTRNQYQDSFERVLRDLKASPKSSA